MPPIVIAAGIAAGGAIAGGAITAHGASQQASAAEKAAAQAAATQRQQQQQNRTDQMPWLVAGGAAENQLARLLGLNTQAQQNKMLTADTANVASTLSGMSAAGALNYAQTVGDPNVSASREQTQSWIAQGIPFQVVNGVAVKTAPTGQQQTDPTMTAQDAGAGGQGSDFGSLMRPFGAADFQTDPGYQFRLVRAQSSSSRAPPRRGCSSQART